MLPLFSSGTTKTQNKALEGLVRDYQGGWALPLRQILRKSSACPKDVDIIAFAPFDFQVLPLKLFVRNGWN